MQHPSYVRSFGRRQGRKLKANRSELMQNLLPKLLIPLPEGMLALEELFPEPKQPLWLEIGFGSGEHLLEQAKHNPEVNFIGCEPYINGLSTLLAKVAKENLANLRLYDGDARDILDKIADHSISKLFVLFPDPWPKARHHKRRIICGPTLDLFAKKLERGGLLRLATDHEDYCTWMLEHLLSRPDFTWTAENQKDWTNPPPDWVVTRYQQKAEAQGRKATFLDWVRVA